MTTIRLSKRLSSAGEWLAIRISSGLPLRQNVRGWLQYRYRDFTLTPEPGEGFGYVHEVILVDRLNYIEPSVVHGFRA